MKFLNAYRYISNSSYASYAPKYFPNASNVSMYEGRAHRFSFAVSVDIKFTINSHTGCSYDYSTIGKRVILCEKLSRDCQKYRSCFSRRIAPLPIISCWGIQFSNAKP